ncbi:MAG: hypothetical protein MJ147_04255 [Clostridia bacterium]|nr:hypothetical protein [Clostridia bacterium]
MENKLTETKQFSALEKIVYAILGALILGAMWRMRGSHGWGSEFGVFTCGLLFTVFIYSVFKRKTNSSYFQIIAASTACMLTTPAWGTLLHQTSGFFEVSVKNDAYAGPMTAECTPWSGVFIMLCLGFGTMPLFLFIVSRLFSDKKYSLVKYISVFAIFFAVFYLANATVSHPIIKLVQPESVAAFKNGLVESGKDGSVYSVYMKHFADINWAKKIPFGRNYFTEITVVSHAIASLVTAIAVRFGFKDKAGGKIIFWGSTAFALGITIANIFFVLESKLSVEKYPFLDDAWSFWEYFTGFIAGLILMIILFAVNKKIPDEGFKDDIVPFIPEKVKNIILCAFVFAFGFGVSTIRPFATRVDDAAPLSIVVWAVGGVAVLAFAVLMLLGKLPQMWKLDPCGVAARLTAVLFSIHLFCYMLIGYGSELPSILVHIPVQYFMMVVAPLTLIGYLIAKRKEIFTSTKE